MLYVCMYVYINIIWVVNSGSDWLETTLNSGWKHIYKVCVERFIYTYKNQ